MNTDDFKKKTPARGVPPMFDHLIEENAQLIDDTGVEIVSMDPLPGGRLHVTFKDQSMVEPFDEEENIMVLRVLGPMLAEHPLTELMLSMAPGGISIDYYNPLNELVFAFDIDPSRQVRRIARA